MNGPRKLQSGILPFRTRFQDSYTAVKCKADNKKGYVIRYIYAGPWYCWNLSREKLRREKGLLLACGLLGGVLFWAAATIPVEFTIRPLWMIPEMLALVLQIFELFALVRFALMPQRAAKIDFDYCSWVLGTVPVYRAILLGISAGLGIVSMLRAEAPVWPAVIAVAGFLACVCLEIVIDRRYRRLQYRTEENHTLRQMRQKGELFDELAQESEEER